MAFAEKRQGLGDEERGPVCSASFCGSDTRFEPAGSGATIRDRPADSGEDADVFSAARVSRRPPARPKLDPFTRIIDEILTADDGRPRKQRHTAKRIFERLRDEHGYSGGITIVGDYVRGRRLQQREVFVPLQHDPGYAKVDLARLWRRSRGSNARSTFLR
jgi:transposase